MPFEFTLEAVLRFRESLEDREKLRLAALVSRRAALVQEYEKSQAWTRLKQGQLNDSLVVEKMCAAHVQFVVTQLRAAEKARVLLQEQIIRLQQLIEQQVVVYRAARHKHELLKGMRESQFESYQAFESRRNQAQLDELFLLRRIRERPSQDLPSAPGNVAQKEGSQAVSPSF
jgi:flagellar export protein FliJ